MTPEQRHNCMSHIHCKDTKPEIIVRKALHAAGLRFRLHVKKLPGTPDIVLRKYHTAIFINGCFWHGHRNCDFATKPKTNENFWKNKIRHNQLRDEVSTQYLEILGWKVITIWECELKPKAREDTIKNLINQIHKNGQDYITEQADRKSRTTEHRAMLKEHKQRYDMAMQELSY